MLVFRAVNLFIMTLAENPFYYFSWILVIMFSICVHEYAHAAVALRLGDDTAAEQGHLSLNPFVQMGVSSIVLLMIIGIAWGAVPVDIRRLRGALASALVSFAGPAANLLLCILFGGLAVGVVLVIPQSPSALMLVSFFTLASVANGVLFVFNMLPVPMFDGWPILSIFIPSMARVDGAQAQQISWILLLLIWLTPLGSLIWAIGGRLADAVMAGWLNVIRLFV